MIIFANLCQRLRFREWRGRIAKEPDQGSFLDGKSACAEGWDFPPLAPHVAGLWAGQIPAYGGGEPLRPFGHRILSYTRTRRETKMRIRPVSGKMTFIVTSSLLQQHRLDGLGML